MRLPRDVKRCEIQQSPFDPEALFDCSILQAQNVELHKLRWEARSREEEIRELQKALSDAKLYLYDEREHVLKLQAENDDLKAQEIEDRKRIAHLLALTEPITQEVS